MPTDTLILDGSSLRNKDVTRVARQFLQVEVSPAATEAIVAGRESIERILRSGRAVYGINTGFGKLADTRVEEDELEQLQLNLVRSHAVGTGQPLSEDEVRAVMLVRLNTLLRGYSGVRKEVVRQLQMFLNQRVYPVIPRYGSLGASGDLAPSAHLAECLIGEGQVFDENKRKLKTAALLRRLHLPALKLKAKEGLSIINGTQVMTGLGALLIDDVHILLRNLDIAAALSLEALGGSLAPFQTRIQKLRPLHGQAHVASRILRLLRDSEFTDAATHIQDPYSLRCIPQVHGAFYDSLSYVQNVIEVELNSVTDNPIVFPETDEVLSAGNFHGQPVSLALDLLGLSVAEASVISERRIDKLLSGYNPDLPLFLTENAGLNSGLMVTQYTAAALVAENKILCRPASAENATVSAGQEDHASMGVTAALKAREVLNFTTSVIAIEVLCAAQALDLLRRGTKKEKRLGQGTEIAFSEVRKVAKPVKSDRSLSADVENIALALKEDRFGKAIGGTVQL